MSGVTPSPPLSFCRVPPVNTRQTNLYAECQSTTLGKSYYMPSVRIWHSANKFFFWFYLPNFLYCCLTIPVALCWSFVHFWVILLYFVSLFELNEFSVIFWIWTASASNIRKKWIKKWYSCHWVWCETVSRPDQKFRTLCSRNMSRNAWRKRLKIL